MSPWSPLSLGSLPVLGEAVEWSCKHRQEVSGIPIANFWADVGNSERAVTTCPESWSQPLELEHLYENMSHPSFPGYSLPLTEPTLCDPTVQQYSGYLDITEGKHLFFWFFEFRSSPFEGPLVLWLNGGPGCSSSTGLLFELRPCSTADKGNTTIHNPYSWNTRMNMIFLDQPVGAGYSYITDGSSVVTSPDAAKGVYAFFELFITRFPKYAKLPFYIVGESHAGRYIPHIAAEINNNNKALASDPSLGLVPVNLVSIMIRNGLVDPLVQMPSIVEYACEGPYAI